MSGFHYLITSGLLVAFCNIMAIDHTSWTSDLRLYVEDVCTSENMKDYLPFWFTCEDRTDVRILQIGVDERIFGGSEKIVQITN